eukprot:Seg2802.1 transcript_id=Seg2802.1/GoldUCD/mRNA.D3Y31 product="Myc proto-oncogene protein" protein_id=Seg2802.1/GoldUCD/D3Y31
MHQNKLPDWAWLRLTTEGGLKRRTEDINIGDLPPKSPEFYEMLPSLRSSPIFHFQAREEENSDTFHVVPSMPTKAIATDTYENFIRNLESNDREYYNNDLPLSPDCFHLTRISAELKESCENLSEDLQIYLQNQISPTPVDELYSTLPAEQSTSTFDFPSFDENQRLENIEVKKDLNDANSNCIPRNIPTQRVFENNDPQTSNSSRKQNRQSRKRRVTENSDDQMSSKSVENDRLMAKNDRPSHNDIERQRRNDMKARFDGLKAVVPEIERVERTPKIQILSKATDFINELHGEEKRLDDEKELERKRNRLLLDKLVQLTQGHCL